MSVLVAVPDSAEGRQALATAMAEAQLRDTTLVVVNLHLGPLDLSALPADLPRVVVERRPDLDVVELVLQALAEHPEADLLVIGMKRRSPVGKAVLGSISQRLLLDAPVAVLGVKATSGSTPADRQP